MVTGMKNMHSRRRNVGLEALKGMHHGYIVKLDEHGNVIEENYDDDQEDVQSEQTDDS
jgi:hypothetical protein